MNKQAIKNAIKDYAIVVFLGIALALDYILFVVKNDFAPAGINGIATMIQYKLNFSIGYMSLIINVPLCVFAFFKINREFAVKTLVFSVVYSFSYLLLQSFDLSDIQYDAQDVDTIYPCLLAGIISGFTYGVSFRHNSCTGGTDIIAKFVSEKKPEFNFFYVTFVMNVIVAVLSVFVYAKTGEGGKFVLDYKPVCLCLVYCFTSTLVGNAFLKGSKSASKFFIITSHVKEVGAEIIKTLHHSATVIRGEGLYSGSERDVLVCVVNKHQLSDFKKIIKKFDDTFAFVETVDETIGNFKKIK